MSKALREDAVVYAQAAAVSDLKEYSTLITALLVELALTRGALLAFYNNSSAVDWPDDIYKSAGKILSD
jgi:hypothetical protein